jgi:hypothetical protein
VLPGIVSAKALAAALELSATTGALGFLTSTKMKTIILASLLAATSAPMVWQHHRLVQARDQNRLLQHRIDELALVRAAEAAAEKARLAEIARLQGENKELYRLRGEVSLLRKTARESAARAAARPATANAAAPEPAALDEQPPQFTIETRFLSFSPEAMRQFEPFATIDRAAIAEVKMGVAEADTAKLLEQASQTTGVELIAAPKVTTLAGREARVSIIDSKNFGSFAIDLGPVVDVTPTMLADNSGCFLQVTASDNEFVGWNDPANKQGPVFRRRSATDQRGTVFGGSVLLGMTEQNPSSAYPATNRLFVLLTPTWIDAAGNRVTNP